MTLWQARLWKIARPARGSCPLCAGGVLALLAVAAVAIDIPLARWLRDLDLTGDLARLVRLAEVFAWGGSVGLIVLLAAVLDHRGWRVGVFLAAASLGSGAAADAAKLLVARTRPAATDLESATATQTFLVWLPAVRREAAAPRYGHGQQSFPSAHSATAVGLALGLSSLYPRGRWLFFAFATLACFQRLAGQAHFLSDVLAGGAIGCLAAGFFAGRFRRLPLQAVPPPPASLRLPAAWRAN